MLDILGETEHGAAFRVEALEDGRLARLELWDRRHVERRGELARFEREARALGRLRHERCLSVVAFGVHDGRPFLVSELPEGKSLRDELALGTLTVHRAVSLGLQLCEGLDHLHRHGLAHRLLLPENLWVTTAPAADSLKIGLPHIAETTDGSQTTARERFYRPPGRASARPDAHADLYAAGKLLYVMCTGREPSEEMVAAAAAGAPIRPPRAVSPDRGISEELERVILRAVAPLADVRFGTAGELMAALRSGNARPAPPNRRPTPSPRKRTAMIAAAFASLAVLGAGVLRGSGRQAPSAPPAALTAEATGHKPRPIEEIPAPPAKVPQGKAELRQPEPPSPPRAAIAMAPIQSAPAAVPPPVAPVVAKSAQAPSGDDHNEIWSLLDSGRLDEVAARLKPLVAADPDAAWPRFALGVFYYRKYYRRDAVRQWQLALAQDPEIRQDPQFGEYLCFMLDDTWKAAGVTDLLNQLGAKSVPLLDHCAASAKSSRLRAQAARTLAELRRSDRRFRR